MLVMGTNTWETEMSKEMLITQALKWAEGLKSQGVAELLEAYLSEEHKLLWCTWKTDNLEALQAAFDAMNKRFGLKSELKVVEDIRKKEE